MSPGLRSSLVKTGIQLSAILAYVVVGLLTYGHSAAHGKEMAVGRGILWPVQLSGIAVKAAGRASVSLFTEQKVEN